MDNLNNRLKRIDECREVLSRINNCLEDGCELNSWEENFLNNLKNNIENGHKTSLTGNEENKLEEIEYILSEGREAFFRDRW